MVHALDASRRRGAIGLHVAARDRFPSVVSARTRAVPRTLTTPRPAPVVRRQVVDALAAQLDGALGDGAALGGQQARDGLQRRRLAGPVGAEERRDTAVGTLTDTP